MWFVMRFRVAIAAIILFAAGACLSCAQPGFKNDNIRFLFDYESETYYVLIDRSEEEGVDSFKMSIISTHGGRIQRSWIGKPTSEIFALVDEISQGLNPHEDLVNSEEDLRDSRYFMVNGGKYGYYANDSGTSAGSKLMGIILDLAGGSQHKDTSSVYVVSIPVSSIENELTDVISIASEVDLPTDFRESIENFGFPMKISNPVSIPSFLRVSAGVLKFGDKYYSFHYILSGDFDLSAWFSETFN